jgi:DNA-directed RNA polymerase alpha subunit
VLDLGMTFRTTNPMVGAGIETVEQAESRTDRELLALRQFGTRSLHEYRSTVADALQELLGPAKARKVLERWADARDART